MKQFVIASFGLAACGCALLASQVVPQPPPAFDVASVKPTQVQIPSGLKTEPGRLVMIGATLNDLIQQAYGVSTLLLSGTPSLGRFNVEGKVDGTHTRAELLTMLQTLLKERFKLTLHREMKEMQVQALVVGKNSKVDPAQLQAATKDVDPAIGARPNATGNTPRRITLTGQNVSMGFLANYLTFRLNRVVVDKTGLGGGFDFAVAPEFDTDRARDLTVPEREVVADLFTNLVPELGLKLESQKAMVEMLVVDHAEIPTED